MGSPLLLGRLREFMAGQSRGYRILLGQGIVTTFLNRLVQNFSNLYIVALGATPMQLSTVRAAGSAVSIMLSIPIGWLSDMYSIKKMMIFGLLVQLLSATCYAFAREWAWIIIALVLAMLTRSLVVRTENIYIANSLTDHNRATGFGVRTTIMQFFSVFAPTIGGLLVHLFGGISVEGIRPLYFIQLAGFLIVAIYVYLNLEDITREKTTPENLLKDFKEMLGTGHFLKRFAILQALGSVTQGMATPFIFLYASEFKGADAITIGYMGTCLVLVAMLLGIPMGSLSDRRGRKFTIFFARPFFWASYLILVFSPKGLAWPLLFSWCLRGVEMGHMSWRTMRMEMVPQEYRGRWTGFVGLLQSLVNLPALIIGGYLYERANPALVFIIPVLIDALIRMPLLASIPETLISKP